MALRILTSQQLLSGAAHKTLVGARACMSSSPSSSNLPVPEKKVKRESLLGMLKYIFSTGMESGVEPGKFIEPDKIKFPHNVEAATGEYKLQLLAFENGFIDPYCNFPIERRGKGERKDDPIKVPSFTNYRMIGCSCEPSSTHTKFMWLYKDDGPTRCQCGFWVQLVEAPKFWLSIPKEDLVEIPFFAELEQEGRLDAFLKGDLDDEYMPIEDGAKEPYYLAGPNAKSAEGHHH